MVLRAQANSSRERSSNYYPKLGEAYRASCKVRADCLLEERTAIELQPPGGPLARCLLPAWAQVCTTARVRIQYILQSKDYLDCRLSLLIPKHLQAGGRGLHLTIFSKPRRVSELLFHHLVRNLLASLRRGHPCEGPTGSVLAALSSSCECDNAALESVYADLQPSCKKH
jgi:hypothetical protein